MFEAYGSASGATSKTTGTGSNRTVMTVFFWHCGSYFFQPLPLYEPLPGGDQNLGQDGLEVVIHLGTVVVCEFQGGTSVGWDETDQKQGAGVNLKRCKPPDFRDVSLSAPASWRSRSIRLAIGALKRGLKW